MHNILDLNIKIRKKQNKDQMMGNQYYALENRCKYITDLAWQVIPLEGKDMPWQEKR